MSKTIEITIEEYNDLKDSEMKLLALKSAGVDNWSGHDFAMELLQEMEEEKSNELLQEESHTQTKEREG